MKRASSLPSKRRLRLLLVCCVPFAMTSIQVPKQQTDVERALKQLRSPSEEARVAVKQQLISFGEKAIPELVSAFQHVIGDERMVFELGSEGEGEEAWKRFAHSIESGEREVTYKGPPDIRGRLEKDVLELLTNLKSRQAVPALLEALEFNMIGTLHEYMNPEMRVLVAIGEGGVPEICEAFITAKAREAATPKYRRADMTDEQRRLKTESRALGYQRITQSLIGVPIPMRGQACVTCQSDSERSMIRTDATKTQTRNRRRALPRHHARQ